MQRSMLVLGGSGFVGQEVCLEGLKRGWTVSSLSRTGAPVQPLTQQLLSQVTWHRGSALDPASYKQPNFSGHGILEDVDYLVHCVRILVPDAQRSYHNVSVETLQMALSQAPKTLKGVGYVSAANFGSAFRSILPDYYASKSEAEGLLQLEAQSRGLAVVIARPGLMWGDGKWLTKPIGLFYNIGTFFAAGLFPRALPAASVAKGMLDNLDDPAGKGKVKFLEVSEMSNVQ